MQRCVEPTNIRVHVCLDKIPYLRRGRAVAAHRDDRTLCQHLDPEDLLSVDSPLVAGLPTSLWVEDVRAHRQHMRNVID
jgi:hypothetical protein